MKAVSCLLAVAAFALCEAKAEACPAVQVLSASHCAQVAVVADVGCSAQVFAVSHSPLVAVNVATPVVVRQRAVVLRRAIFPLRAARVRVSCH